MLEPKTPLTSEYAVDMSGWDKAASTLGHSSKSIKNIASSEEAEAFERFLNMTCINSDGFQDIVTEQKKQRRKKLSIRDRLSYLAI